MITISSTTGVSASNKETFPCGCVIDFKLTRGRDNNGAFFVEIRPTITYCVMHKVGEILYGQHGSTTSTRY